MLLAKHKVLSLSNYTHVMYGKTGSGVKVGISSWEL